MFDEKYHLSFISVPNEIHEENYKLGHACRTYKKKNLSHLHVRKAYRVAEVKPHSFSTSTMDGGERSAIRIGCFTPGERAPWTHQTKKWV